MLNRSAPIGKPGGPSVVIWGRGLTLTGGNRSYVRQICETLGQRCRITVLTNWRSDGGEEIPGATLRFVTMDDADDAASRAAFLFRSVSALAACDADVIHAIGSRAIFAAAARFAGVASRRRVLLECTSPVHPFVAKLRFGAVVGPSKRVVSPLGPRARLLRRPIDIEAFQQPVQPYALGDGPPVVGAMAVPDRRHGLRELIESAKHLPKGSFRLLIAMPVEQARFEPEVAQGLTAVHRRVAELGLTDTVTWMGRVEPARFFRSVDCFVFPAQTAKSMVDTPTTVLECLASSCPIVTTSVGGIVELGVEHAGCVLPPGREGDPVALASAIQSILEDTDRRRRIRGILVDAIRRHEKSVVLDDLMDLYSSLAS